MSDFNILEKIKTNKKLQISIICILIFLLILLVGISFISDNKVNSSDDFTIEAYVQNLEKKLEEKLNKVEGVKNASVIITVSSKMKTVLATETIKTEENGKVIIEEKPILVNGKTVTISEEYPDIIGVLIVLEGTNSISVINRVQQATVTLLNINLSQIEILTGK